MEYFLGLILALLPTYLIRFRIGIPTTLLEILIVVFLFTTLLKLIAKPSDLSKIKQLGKINYVIAGFALAAIISTLISPDKRVALGQLKAFIIEPVLLFYAILLTIKADELKTSLKWLLLSASVISLFGILQYFTFILLPLRFWGTGAEVERITSFFDYPNALALYLAPLIGFYFTLWLKKYSLGIKNYTLATALAIMSIALILTFSRGGLVAAVVVCALLLVQHYGCKKTLPSMVICALILFLISPIRQRLLLGLTDPSSNAHFGLWQIAFEKITQNPIFGNGLAGFATLNLSVNYPHNLFLNFWLELGLLGLVSFCAIVILAWQTIKKNQPLSLAAGVFLLILVLHGFVDVPYFKNDLSVMFWFTISIFYLNKF
jgi:putative inorganic carbon (HCO3(-)) transporter